MSSTGLGRVLGHVYVKNETLNKLARWISRAHFGSLSRAMERPEPATWKVASR